MGYRKTTRLIEVSLKGHEVYGHDTDVPVARVRGKSLAEFLVLEGLSDAPDGDARSLMVRQLEEFGDALVSWNLEDETGNPLPCNREGLFAIDNDLALALATEWMECLAGKVEAPLPQSSPAGEPSPAPSAIPMAPLSEHPAPTSVPA